VSDSFRDEKGVHRFPAIPTVTPGRDTVVHDVKPNKSDTPITRSITSDTWGYEFDRRVFGGRDMTIAERNAIVASGWNGRDQLSGEKVFKILERFGLNKGEEL
jgi:hypothetical protein